MQNQNSQFDRVAESKQLNTPQVNVLIAAMGLTESRQVIDSSGRRRAADLASIFEFSAGFELVLTGSTGEVNDGKRKNPNAKDDGKYSLFIETEVTLPGSTNVETKTICVYDAYLARYRWGETSFKGPKDIKVHCPF